MTQSETNNSKPVDIQVYILELQKLVNNYDAFYSLLNKEEQSRANQLKIENKRLQFVLTRGVLKDLLAEKLKLAPLEIKLNYAEHGKPFLSPEINPENIEFNVSHSNDYAAIAISKNVKLGIDVEQIRSDMDFDNLAKRFFSKDEYEYLMSLEKEGKQTAFFSIWSAKEAFIKAQGDGVSFGLDKFSVPFSDAKGLVQISSNKDSSHIWQLENFSNIEGYSMAVCVNKCSENINIQCY